jgi:hypothetical protein
VVDKIILHVGAEKTGSTSLQGILCDNPHWLGDAQAHYPVHPDYKRIRANAKLLTFALQQRLPETFQRNFPKTDVATLDPAIELNNLLDQCPMGTKTAVLSSELLRSHTAAALKKVIPKGVQCHVILIVRRQDDWLQSYFSQCLKGGQNVDLNDLVERIQEPTELGFSCPDWAWHYQAWQQEFEDCSVIFYDDHDHPHQAQFFDLIGAKPDISCRNAVPLNLGFPSSAMAYLSGLDGNMPKDIFMQHVIACRNCAKTLRPAENRISILSPQHRQKLIARFARGNEAITQAFGVDPSILSIPVQDPNFVSLQEHMQSAAYHQFHSEVIARLPKSAQYGAPT